MPVAVQILAGLAAVLHVLFFYLESIAFTRKASVAKTFGSNSPEETQVLKGIFLNQGFYNLFLAIGVFVGLIASASYDAGKHLAEVLRVFTGAPGADGTPVPGSAGAITDALGHGNWGQPVVVFGLACMLGAAVVLLVSSGGKMLRGALIQGVAPLLALVILALS